VSEAEFWQGSLARLVVVGAISGALAGAATDVLLHPVEKIKTRLQSAGAVELLRGAGRLAVLRELFSGCYQVTSFIPMERLILYRPARPPARSLACPPARPAVGAARARRAFMSPFPPVLSGHVSSLLPHYLDTSRPSSRTKWTRLPPRLPGAGASLLPGLLRTVRPRPAPPTRHPPRHATACTGLLGRLPTRGVTSSGCAGTLRHTSRRGSFSAATTFPRSPHLSGALLLACRAPPLPSAPGLATLVDEGTSLLSCARTSLLSRA